MEDLVFGFIVKLVDNATPNASKIRKEIDLLSMSIDKMARRDKKLQPTGIEKFANKARRSSSAAQSLSGSTNRLSVSMLRLSRRSRSAGSGMNVLRNSVIGITTSRIFSGLRRAIRGVSSALADAIKVGANFDRQMTLASSTMGASTVESRRLRDEAKRIGATTSATARDAAGLMLVLAQAGFRTKTVLSMSGPLIKFAGAAMMQTGRAALFVTDALGAFGWQVKDTRKMTDLLVAGFTSSKTTAAQLQDALRQAGPVAASLGRRARETVEALGVFAQAGFRGQQGGIAFRNVMLSIITPSKNLDRALKYLNLSMADLNPKNNDLVTIFRRLRPLMNATGIAGKLFGKRTAAAFLAVAKKGEKGFLDIRREMGKAMTTAQFYEKLMNTVAGRMDILKSAVEALKIELFDVIKPVVKQDLKDATGLINGIMRAVRRGAPVVRAAFGIIGDTFRFTFQIMQMSLGGLGKAFEKLSKKGKMTKQAIMDTVGPLLLGVTLIKIEILNFMEGLISGIRKGFKTASSIIFPFVGLLFKVGIAVGKMTGFIEEGSSSAKKFGKIIGGMIGVFAAFAAAKIALLIPQFVIGSTVSFVVGIKRIAFSLFSFLIPAQTAATASQAGLNAAMFANPVGLIVAGIAALIGIVYLAIRYWDTWTGWLQQSGFWMNALIWGLTLVGLGFLRIPLLIIKYWNPLKAFFSSLWQSFVEEAAGVIKWFTQNWAWMTNWATTLWRVAGILVKAVWVDIRNSVLSVWRGFMGYLNAALEKLKKLPVIGKAVRAFIVAREKDLAAPKKKPKPEPGLADKFIAARSKIPVTAANSSLPQFKSKKASKSFNFPTLPKASMAITSAKDLKKAPVPTRTAIGQIGTNERIATQSQRVQAGTSKTMVVKNFNFAANAINIETQIKDAEELARSLLPALKRIELDEERRGAN